MSEGSLITGVLVLELEPGDRLEAGPVPVTGSDTVDWSSLDGDTSRETYPDSIVFIRYCCVHWVKNDIETTTVTVYNSLSSLFSVSMFSIYLQSFHPGW